LSEPHVQRRTRPWIWFFLNLPFGATSGFVTVMLGFILSRQGASDAVVAGIGALNLFPHTWKVFWAPIADSTLTRKRWYMLSNGVSCSIILIFAFTPITLGNLGTIEILILINSFAVTFIGMSVEGLMAHATPPAERGRAAGWFQAGNLGGSGLGGFIGLKLANEFSTTVAFITITSILASCTFGLLFVPEAPRLLAAAGAASRGLGASFVAAVKLFIRSIQQVLRELWQMVATRRGIIAVALVFLPIGSAAIQYLFAGKLATEWKADENAVEMYPGLYGGLISAVGCLVGGLMSDKLGRRPAYLSSGIIMAVIAVGWALMPQTPLMYKVFVLLYNFGAGIAFGCFTGFVLEMIGAGAAATKYNALASLSNIPILYMTKVNGWASTEHGPVTMLFVDAASEIIGVVILLALLVILRPGREQPLPAHLATEVAQEHDR
jgi:MFS family permease